MTIFYNSNSLHDTLIIHIHEENVTNVVKKGDLTYLYHDQEVVGINIDKVSEKFVSLAPGYIYATDYLRIRLEALTGIDLPPYDNKLIVGKIIACEPVVNTHLHTCKVDIGHGQVLQIVCGAANAREGLKTVVALDNCMLPNGKIIKVGPLMGIKSEGMLCSFAELNLVSDQKGIIEVPDDEVIGCVYRPAFSNLSTN